ncbi:MAG: hypothetical protein IJT34_04515 [Butyrivibrio sp.]|nr:hypothetical protein [Butyrivibrio sp.]
MNRKKMLLPAAVCMAMLLAACGSTDKTTETTSIMQPMETATTQEKAEQPAEQNQAAADQKRAADRGHIQRKRLPGVKTSLEER